MTRKISTKLAKITLAWGIALVAAACSSGPAPATFDLTAPRGPVRGRPSGQFVVAEPLSLLIYDGDRIVVRQGDQVAVLKGGQWADRLPRLIQTRLIQTFENVGMTAGIGRPGERITPDRQINIDIRAFEVNADLGEAVVEITVKLIRDATGRVSASRVFTAREPATADAASAAAALDTALSRVLVDIVSWTAGRG
ncbi:ABC-type transport auxiliary lipoprotein family protein [Terrarubrum flagellatum]|uniref:ABC-type transport auxiliary lipoprotein family protein n=1 Tax=Terrirubrum flagellatum TaxID=2895980 RepID=UPI00314502EE